MAAPSRETLPGFDLPTTDGGRFTNADLVGAPHVLYLSRHTGCFVCQAKLGELLEHRETLRAQGGDVVVLFPATVDHLVKWRRGSRIPDDVTVVADEDASLYDAVGTVRGSYANVFKLLGGLWASRKHLGSWRLTSQDMLRMGADLAVDADGEVVLWHIAQNPTDRARPDALLGALARTPVPA